MKRAIANNKMIQTININNSAVNIESLHDNEKAPQERLSSAIVMIEAMKPEEFLKLLG